MQVTRWWQKITAETQRVNSFNCLTGWRILKQHWETVRHTKWGHRPCQAQLREWQGWCWHPFIKGLCTHSSPSCCDLPCAFHDLCFDASPTRELKQPGRGPPSLCKHLLSLHRNSTPQNRRRISSSSHNICFPSLVFSSAKSLEWSYPLLTILPHLTLSSPKYPLFSIKKNLKYW